MYNDQVRGQKIIENSWGEVKGFMWHYQETYETLLNKCNCLNVVSKFLCPSKSCT